VSLKGAFDFDWQFTVTNLRTVNRRISAAIIAVPHQEPILTPPRVHPLTKKPEDPGY